MYNHPNPAAMFSNLRFPNEFPLLFELEPISLEHGGAVKQRPDQRLQRRPSVRNPSRPVVNSRPVVTSQVGQYANMRKRVPSSLCNEVFLSQRIPPTTDKSLSPTLSISPTISVSSTSPSLFTTSSVFLSSPPPPRELVLGRMNQRPSDFNIPKIVSSTCVASQS